MKSKPFEFYGEFINTLVCNNLSDCYPFLNNHIYKNGLFQKSRIGLTSEILNLKTVIRNPYNRCVSGNKRRINIFFLLAESLWIIGGRNDLFFINIFNSKFKNYSDDNETLHGAYGQRIRKWEDKSNNIKIDQLLEVLELLDKDRDSRRAVLSLWNPILDLNIYSKDIPCNNLLMYKIRENKLYLTVANRSNDLHWGFISDFFNFSFLSDVISSILGISLGDQSHLSQSMHIYLDNPLVNKMLDYDQSQQELLYHKYASSPFIFKYSQNSVKQKLQSIDIYILEIIEFLSEYYITQHYSLKDFNMLLNKLDNTSISLKEIFFLLFTYIEYKLSDKMHDINTFEKELQSILNLRIYNSNSKFLHFDYYILALNFFLSKTTSSDKLSDNINDQNLGNY